MPAIRPATVADAEGIARVDVETWRTAYAGILPDPMLLNLSERQRTAGWSRLITRRPGDTVVAVDWRNNVIGFGSCGMQRDVSLPYAGEVFTLYVTPDFQGRDLGRQLLLVLFARLIRCGLYSSVIWVLKDNPARFFYERLGGQAVAHRKLPMGKDFEVDAIAYAWRDLPDAVHNRARAKSRIE